MKFLIFGTLLLAPIATMILPQFKDWVIAITEFVAESAILFLLTKRLRSNSASKYRSNERILLLAMSIAFVADCLYSLRILNLATDSGLYNSVVELLYGAFAITFMIAVARAFITVDNFLSEWGWFGFFSFLINIFLSFKFIVIPYYAESYTLLLKINSTIYALASAVTFSVVLPLASRVIERKVYWFSQLTLFFLTADFAIRYQTSFVSITTFSWAEFGWCSFFVGFMWIVYYSDNSSIMLAKHTMKTSFVSVRNLLTLVVCGANALFLVGILLFKLYEPNSANDVSSILFLLFSFWLIANEFSWKLSNDLARIVPKMFKGKETANVSGEVSYLLQTVNAKTSISEISDILDSYNKLVMQTNRMIESTAISNQNAAMAKVAAQVSHDIRSPLTALNFLTLQLKDIPENTRIVIREATQRINDIANELLASKKVLRGTADNILNINSTNNVEPLSTLIDSLISEKRIQLRAHSHIIQIRADLGNSYAAFVNFKSSDLKRVVSNIIDNSIDAVSPDTGKIELSISIADGKVSILIADNGKGIPENIIEKVGTPGFSYGKRDKNSGSGLGLSHAIKTIEDSGGRLNLSSTFGIGTEVCITLPLISPPSWFVEEIRLPFSSMLVSVDDDQSIHSIWSSRVSEDIRFKMDLNVVQFTSLSLFQSWYQTLPKEVASKCIIVMDHEFIDSRLSGLSLITSMNIQKNAILVTSHHNNPEVINQCQLEQIKLIPKSMAPIVPLTFEAPKTEFDLVLIDDDQLVQKTWKFFAEDKRKNILCLSSFDEFLAASKNISVNTPLYVDFELRYGMDGNQVAKRLYDMGYQDITIATGHEADFVPKSAWIKGVIGKVPPF